MPQRRHAGGLPVALVTEGRLRVQQQNARLEDEGPGLNSEQRRQIFERFVRFGPPSSADKGSGLGLAISRSIVQLHKGRIFATAREGTSGLKMVIEIPAAA